MIHVLRNSIIAVSMMITCLLGASAQKTYIVSVGLNNYDNGENPLPSSVGDAKAIAKFFKSYNNSEVFLLLDKNATRDHILRVLKAKFAKSTSKDEVIFAYSGHGFDGGISCYDTKNVIFCSEIQNIMKSTRAKRKVMFINSCHSGSFSKKYRDSKDSRRNYKSSNSNVMLYLSSRANEYSWERSDMTTSFFFKNLINGLIGYADKNGDGMVTARELFNYTNARVITETDGAQHPQMFGKFSDDMVVVRTK